MEYGNAWRHQRKTVQGLLNVTVVDTMMPIQNAEALQILHHLLTEPEGYYDHFRRYSTAVILASVFGQREDRFESPKIQTLYSSQDRFTKLLEPGATPPVDAFRFLRYLPEFMCSWKREVKYLRKIEQSMYYRYNPSLGPQSTLLLSKRNWSWWDLSCKDSRSKKVTVCSEVRTLVTLQPVSSLSSAPVILVTIEVRPPWPQQASISRDHHMTYIGI
jgi:hypothetical protein